MIPVVSYIEAGSLNSEVKNEKAAQVFLTDRLNNAHWTAFKQEGDLRFQNVDFILSFTWVKDMEMKLFTDLWLQDQLDSYGPCGPRTDQILVVVDGEFTRMEGIACGDTRIISGREEEYRRSLLEDPMGPAVALRKYLYGKGPELPSNMTVPWPDNVK